MFEKILIANRGEIACRIIESARKLGVATVAVYSDADRFAKHTAMADEAVHIGGPAPRDSYLRGDVIIRAALETGAEAIHPGYGFLSENPDFVDALEAAGLVFIGPSADAIRKMGLKDAAKTLMADSGVPVVPGYHGSRQDADYLAGQAAEIGFPVLIKAVAGGGGKGMRLVDRRDEFQQALANAQSEAMTSFGNAAVLVEKYIKQPRHIEVQIFGDGTRAVHLFERDCSLQRRHQKVIEEAPAPGMTGEMRQAMGRAAVRAAETINYRGAGTVEFIVDASAGLRPDRFWFMEMNTRLQVEHPVTEAITGVDLVEWQLRVAAGETLPLRQEDLQINGHAFEARLYAEDVAAGFLPATGKLAHLQFPAGARVESGVREGDEISPWYDPMIAKLVTWGPTREVALGALNSALVDTEVAGTVTNLDFLIALTRHSGFVAGQVDTGLIARDLDALLASDPAPKALTALAVIGLAGLDVPSGLSSITLWKPLRRTIAYRGGEAVLEILAGGAMRVTLDGDIFEIVRRNGQWSLNGALIRAKIIAHGDAVSVFSTGTVTLHRLDPLAVEDRQDGSGLTVSPMPGLVRAVFVNVDEHVAQGARLAVLEAMKMEHTLTAARAGQVAEILVRPGDQVEAGAALIRLAGDEE